MQTMSEAAKEERRKYQREWYRENKTRYKTYKARYWERKAEETRQKEEAAYLAAGFPLAVETRSNDSGTIKDRER